MNGKKILLLAPQPFYANRGTPMNVREMLSVLSAAGHQITLLAYPFGEPLPIPGVRIKRSPRLPFINSIPIGPSWRKLALDIPFFFSALLESFRERYDLFHGIEECGPMAGVLGMLRGRPFVVDVDSSMSDQLRTSGFVTSPLILQAVESIERFFFRRASAVITVCQALTNEVKRIEPRSRIFQIEDFPIEADSCAEQAAPFNLRRQWNIPDERKIVLYAGNFASYQGIDLLVQGFSAAAKVASGGRAQLVLVGGNNSEIAYYKQVAEQLELNGHVSFTGPLPSSLMPEVHAQADVLVSPRLNGTNTPLKIYSYMQAGKPIVATKIYSHTQVLSEECAYLSDPEAGEFGRALEAALCDDAPSREEQRLKVAVAQQLVTERYSRDCFREKLLRVYSAIFPQ